jgi:hypothetical protein
MAEWHKVKMNANTLLVVMIKVIAGTCMRKQTVPCMPTGFHDENSWIVTVTVTLLCL